MTVGVEIGDAVQVLKDGGLVAFPTETVYGLGADASSPQAVAAIYALKGRPSRHPVIVHIADVQQIREWARDIPATAWRLAEEFWPGPLTLILRRAPNVPDAVTGGQDSVGLRVPSHPVAQALLRAFGGGVAAPSANRYGRISPTLASHVAEDFGADAVPILDGGDCEVGLESTIVSLVDKPILLRPGGISRAAIEAVIGPLADAAGNEVPRAPGTTVSHYAPVTPMRWFNGKLDEVSPEAAVYAARRKPDSHRGLWLQAPADPIRYGHDLYAALRTLDHAGAPVILVEAPPDEPEWEAVRDRLRRSAAAYTDTNLS